MADSPQSRLREVLEKTGTSQKDLAHDLGIDPGYMSRILSGHRLPGRSVAVELERRFGIPVSGWEEP